MTEMRVYVGYDDNGHEQQDDSAWSQKKKYRQQRLPYNWRVTNSII
jgi:hypothetical protein